jgi:hypothetical protein
MFFAGALLPGAALADGLTVDATRCASRIRIEADQVPLGDVLQRLSTDMGFRLVARTELTERVSRDLSGAPEDVLKRLMQGRNLVVDSNPDAKCGGRQTLTTIWVLPAGQAVDRAAGAPQGPVGVESTQASVPQQVRPPRPRGTRRRMSDAEWQQMKKDYMAGKVKADPKTGLPVPVDAEPAAPTPP